ncbi:hypothetical protein SDC9_123434 [bioreactor metagenome]|uniref:Uncharacterized protein n=1 Tax=bioreactor metagenome TaxID=1076179 RepID=A0A645CHN0_9ZZZZ
MLLKENYSFIHFPVANKNPEEILSLYSKEFSISKPETITQIKMIFANALRDYLSGKIGEWELGSLAFSLSTDKQLSSIVKQDQKLSKIISECVDIKWLSEGKSFDRYKKELQIFLNSIISE